MIVDDLEFSDVAYNSYSEERLQLGQVTMLLHNSQEFKNNFGAGSDEDLFVRVRGK